MIFVNEIMSVVFILSDNAYIINSSGIFLGADSKSSYRGITKGKILQGKRKKEEGTASKEEQTEGA